MSNSDSAYIPKSAGGDVLHTLAKAGLSAVPVIGGPAAEIFSMLLVPPLQRRRDEWMSSIAEGLQALEMQLDGYKIENLSENEMFVTTVMQASGVAIRTHQKEKLDALRNAVLNSSLPNAPEDDLQLKFLSFVDSLTSWHLKILSLFQNPSNWFHENGIAFDITMGSPASVLQTAFPQLERNFYDQLVKDLFAKGLFGIDSLHTMMSLQGMLTPRTTEMGNQFLKFIASPRIG